MMIVYPGRALATQHLINLRTQILLYNVAPSKIRFSDIVQKESVDINNMILKIRNINVIRISYLVFNLVKIIPYRFPSHS